MEAYNRYNAQTGSYRRVDIIESSPPGDSPAGWAEGARTEDRIANEPSAERVGGHTYNRAGANQRARRSGGIFGNLGGGSGGGIFGGLGGNGDGGGIFGGLSRLIPGLGGELGGFFKNFGLNINLGGLETEDLILMLILYLMYRETGDTELLIALGAMLFV